MAAKYIYHGAQGDRILTLLSENEDGTVDLCDDKGKLDIGVCPVNGKLGGCTPVEAKKAKKAKDSKETDGAGGAEQTT